VLSVRLLCLRHIDMPAAPLYRNRCIAARLRLRLCSLTERSLSRDNNQDYSPTGWYGQSGSLTSPCCIVRSSTTCPPSPGSPVLRTSPIRRKRSDNRGSKTWAGSQHFPDNFYCYACRKRLVNDQSSICDEGVATSCRPQQPTRAKAARNGGIQLYTFFRRHPLTRRSLGQKVTQP